MNEALYGYPLLDGRGYLICKIAVKLQQQSDKILQMVFFPELVQETLVTADEFV